MTKKLKVVFNQNQYPPKEMLEFLAENSEETANQIKRWFRVERKKKFEKGTMSYEVTQFSTYF